MSRTDDTTVEMTVGDVTTGKIPIRKFNRGMKKLAVDLDEVDRLKHLEELNRSWFSVQGEKAAAAKAFNEQLKDIEQDIESLLGELSDAKARRQPKLPMEMEVPDET